MWKYRLRKTCRGGGGGENYEGRTEERKDVTSSGNSMGKGLEVRWSHGQLMPPGAAVGGLQVGLPL